MGSLSGVRLDDAEDIVLSSPATPELMEDEVLVRPTPQAQDGVLVAPTPQPQTPTQNSTASTQGSQSQTGKKKQRRNNTPPCTGQALITDIFKSSQL